MRKRFLSGAVLVLAAILTGCASSLPPAQPATSLESIAGKWEGSIKDSSGIVLYTATLVIRKDGTCEAIVPGDKGSPFTGTIVVQDGQYRWTDSKTGSKGLLVLHEGNGKRVLIRTIQGLESTGTYEPAK